MGQAFKSDSTSFTTASPEDMVATVMKFAEATDAEALKLLRSRLPDRSLSMRVAALDILMRRKSRAFDRAYIPR